MNDNSVLLAGNLTRDPELRFTQSGTAVCTLGLAVNRRYMQNNEWKDDVEFFNVIVWNQLGENAGSSLTKGARIVVSGRIAQREYEDKEGATRRVTEIVADEVAASLKWATATIERTQRTTAQSNRPAANAPIPDHAPAPDTAVYGDEEPF